MNQKSGEPDRSSESWQGFEPPKLCGQLMKYLGSDWVSQGLGIKAHKLSYIYYKYY